MPGIKPSGPSRRLPRDSASDATARFEVAREAHGAGAARAAGGDVGVLATLVGGAAGRMGRGTTNAWPHAGQFMARST